MHSTTFLAALDLPLDVPCALNLTALSLHRATLVDYCKKRGVRYPLVPLLLVALLAKLAGYSRLSDSAEWAHLRASELTSLLGLERTTMPHASIWSPYDAKNPFSIIGITRTEYTDGESSQDG